MMVKIIIWQYKKILGVTINHFSNNATYTLISHYFKLHCVNSYVSLEQGHAPSDRSMDNYNWCSILFGWSCYLIEKLYELTKRLIYKARFVETWLALDNFGDLLKGSITNT
jgi:hypothetical protein